MTMLNTMMRKNMLTLTCGAAALLSGCSKEEVKPDGGNGTGNGSLSTSAMQVNEIYLDAYRTAPQSFAQLAFLEGPAGGHVTVAGYSSTTTASSATYTVELNKKVMTQMANTSLSPAQAGNAVQTYSLNQTLKGDTLAVVYNNKHEMTRAFIASNNVPEIVTTWASGASITEAEGRTAVTTLTGPRLATQAR